MYYVFYAWVWLRTRFLRTRAKIADARRAFPLYLRTIRLNPDFPRMSIAPCQESEYPYRDGTAVVFRIVGMSGLTLGIMHTHVDMSERAINGRLLTAIQSADGGKQFVQKVQEANPDAEWLQEHGIDPALFINLEDTIEPEA